VAQAVVRTIKAKKIIGHTLNKSSSSEKSARIIGNLSQKLIGRFCRGGLMPVKIAKIVKSSILFLIMAMHLSTCKSLYDLKNYSKSSAKGNISGVEWIYAYAYTNPEAKLAEGQEIMIVLATGKPKHACPDTGDQLPDAREVAVAIDGKMGEMKIGAPSDRLETANDMFSYRKTERQAAVAFFDPSKPTDEQYKFATSGKVKITKMTNEVIEGAVLAKVNKTSFINGRFKAKVCKYGQLN